MMTRKELSPINESQPTAWEEFVCTETRRKVAKCLGDLSRSPKSAIMTVKHWFWETCDTIKALEEASEDFESSVKVSIATNMSKCIKELGESVSQSEVRTITHWFGILETDILEG
jgi:ribosome recycling factor